ncbi:MAG: hypothetical protein R3B47_19430 [Bacteroidia bacterium]
MALWRGRAQEAVEAFMPLWEQHPEQTEYGIALGQAPAGSLSLKLRERSFSEVLMADPFSEEATSMLTPSASFRHL